MTTVLRTQGLTRVLPGEVPVTLVEDINLKIEQGEFVAVMGPSGSGKSSLLYLLGLLDMPTSGKIWLNDTDTAGLNEDELADLRLRQLGFVFQFHFLLAEFSAAGFTLMSILCSTAGSIQEMILWRACQGFIGGAMIPTVFASAFSIFPKNKQATITPLIGLVATLAPTVGPTAGGYLTDLFSWHWLFLVNVLPGIVVTAVSWFLIDFDKPDFKLLRQFDWTGFLTMAGFLGALEYVLEEGPTDNWFDSDTITLGVAFSALSAVLFFWRALTAKNPVVDLSMFKDRNFWTGSLFSFVLGVGLYGLTYLYPVYLSRVRGYSALQIGETLFLRTLRTITATNSARASG